MSLRSTLRGAGIAYDRQAILLKAAALAEERVEVLARTISAECGKTLAEAMAEASWTAPFRPTSSTRSTSGSARSGPVTRSTRRQRYRSNWALSVLQPGQLPPWAGGRPRLLTARGGERAGHPGVDEWLDAELEFPGGAVGRARCHMAADDRSYTYRIIGSRGEATATNFVQPHLDDRVTVTTIGGSRVEQLGRRSSYAYQLEAFAAHLRHGAPLRNDGDDAVATMQLIDDCYRAAGFTPRPRSQPVPSR